MYTLYFGTEDSCENSVQLEGTQATALLLANALMAQGYKVQLWTAATQLI